MEEQLRIPPFFERLGLRPAINGYSWVSFVGGSIMAPEVLQAMTDAAPCFLDMHELNQKAGEVVARHTGAEAGLVTASACAGMQLQAAACMTGADPARIARLPDTAGMRNQVLIPSTHLIEYAQSYRTAGARLVQWGTPRAAKPWELEEAICGETAALAYIMRSWRHGDLPLSAAVEIAHSRQVPVVVDASGMVPPPENLTRFIAAGADMVTYSGGKGLEGPQSTGILCGRADLIEAARLNMSPYAGVGRPAKVGKEEIAGLLVALERFAGLDHEGRWKRWRVMARTIIAALEGIEGLTLRLEEDNPPRQGPQPVIYFDPSWKGPSSTEVQEALVHGDPPIYIGVGGYRDELFVATVTLREGEEHIVARRLKEQLSDG